ncbi:MAG: hypothetical protein KAJ66_04865 [Candidatus Omnitrophica bacterium]|nr:hypothetical protein [Candidatus Omnitrophota bacterium]
MRRFFLTGRIFIVVVFVLLFSLSVQAAGGENLLLNPDFEDNGGEWWSDAAYWEKGGNVSWVGVTTVNSHSQEWSFSVGNDHGPGNASGCCLQVLRDPGNSTKLYPVSQGDVFTFSMWMAGEENHTGSAAVKIEFYGYDRRDGDSGPPLKSFSSAVHKGKLSYFKETVTAEAPGETVSVAVVCLSEDNETGSGGSLVNFDDGEVVVNR